jgi:hypothetical protein
MAFLREKSEQGGIKAYSRKTATNSKKMKIQEEPV